MHKLTTVSSPCQDTSLPFDVPLGFTFEGNCTGLRSTKLALSVVQKEVSISRISEDTVQWDEFAGEDKLQNDGCPLVVG